VTSSFFSDWVTEVFGHIVCDYLREKDLPLKVLLAMDSAPAHLDNLKKELTDELSFIRLYFLPLNTTSLLQHMD